MSTKHRRPHLHKVPMGQCRWCGGNITNEKGKPAMNRHWHPQCVVEFKIAAWPADARFAAWVKNKGICQGCGTDLAAAAHAIHPSGTVESLRTRIPSWAPK